MSALCRRRSRIAVAAAPWVIAGGLLFVAAPAMAQDDATPEAVTAVTVADDAAGTAASDTAAGAGGATTTAVPRTGAGILAGGEGSWASLGAIAGAAVAAAYALRERMANRR